MPGTGWKSRAGSEDASEKGSMARDASFKGRTQQGGAAGWDATSNGGYASDLSVRSNHVWTVWRPSMHSQRAGCPPHNETCCHPFDAQLPILCCCELCFTLKLSLVGIRKKNR
jgi:hypothetical protein